MASWRKLLARMCSDQNPTSYTFDEAVTVLGHLGFALAKSKRGSHRRARRKMDDGRTIIIGLHDAGSGPMKKDYVLYMVQILRSNNLLPPDGVNDG